MSRKGNCWDNAVAESFFSSVKKERIKKQIYKNRELALNDVADYIDRFYKLHRSLLQSDPPPQSPRRREPRAVRSGSETAVTGYPPKPGNSMKKRKNRGKGQHSEAVPTEMKKDQARENDDEWLRIRKSSA